MCKEPYIGSVLLFSSFSSFQAPAWERLSSNLCFARVPTRPRLLARVVPRLGRIGPYRGGDLFLVPKLRLSSLYTTRRGQGMVGGPGQAEVEHAA